ncbi:MAG: glycosyltransferase [Candidatus Falkowbacteria bacterium]
MRIAVINNLYKPYNRGGAEAVAEEIVKQASALGHQVFVISTAPDKSYFLDNTYYLKSSYYNLGQKSLLFRALWQINNLFNLRKYYQIKNILQKNKIDLVISNNIMGLGFFLPYLCQKLKIRNIQILHDIQLLHPSGLMYFGEEKIIDSLGAKLYQYFTRQLFATPELVVAPSHWLLDLYTQKAFFLNSKKVVLENPVKTKDATAITTDKVDGEITNFLYVGQIEKHKGALFLAETFKAIVNPFITLTIIGDGSLRAELKEIIKNDKRITYLGKRAKDEVLAAMASANAVIVPSLCYENSPTVIYEALSVKTSFIGSNIGGIPELSRKYGGLLFRAGDKEDLKGEIEYFANHHNDFKITQTKNEAPQSYLVSLLKNL